MLFTSRFGRQITGSEQASFSSVSSHIPNNTQACAMIKSFKINQFEGEHVFQILWKIIDGDFANKIVKQTIKPFEKKDSAAERHLNMLYRIFLLCGHRTDYMGMPDNDDLAKMNGNVLSIKIGNGIIQGQERTWVREVWHEGEIETKTGESDHAGEKNIHQPTNQLSAEEMKKEVDRDVPF